MKNMKKMSIILSVFILTLIAFAPVVYAGFSRQFNPEVKKFGITIGTHENIMISSNGNKGTFKDSLSANEIINDREITVDTLTGKVTHTVDGEYENLILTDASGTNADSNKYFTFELYFLSTRNMNVYLNSSSGAIIELDESTADSSFSDEDRTKLLDGVRIAFLSYSTIYKDAGSIYEAQYSEEPVSVNVYSRTGIDTDNYETFNRLDYSNNPELDTILFTTEKEKVTKVEVVIWVESEGLDVNLTAMCNFTLSMKFNGIIID